MVHMAIIGGAGFVGANLALAALSQGNNVVLVDSADRLCRLRHTGLLGQVGLRMRDVSDPDSLDDLTVDLVVHLSALPHVDYSLRFPEQVIANNLATTCTVLAYARRYDVPIIHTSSVEVYGCSGANPADESRDLNPLSPYALSKVLCEELISYYVRQYGINVCVLRLTNLYGPLQAPDRVIPRLIVRGLLSLPVEVSAGVVRDFLYVGDAVEAILRLIRAPRWGQTYNLCSGKGIGLLELAEEVSKQVGDVSWKLTQNGSEGRGAELIACPTRLISDTGWSPSVSLTDGIGWTVQWYRENRSWWRALESVARSERVAGQVFLVDQRVPLRTKAPGRS